jgi:hypothetical protein
MGISLVEVASGVDEGVMGRKRMWFWNVALYPLGSRMNGASHMLVPFEYCAVTRRRWAGAVSADAENTSASMGLEMRSLETLCEETEMFGIDLYASSMHNYEVESILAILSM